MIRFALHIFVVLTLAALTLTTVSCTKSQSTPQQSAPVLLEHDKNGNVVIRLLGEGDAGVWKLKSEDDDILVERKEDDMFSIRAAFTFPNGGTCEVATQLKAQPGQRVPISAMGKQEILIEFPES